VAAKPVRRTEGYRTTEKRWTAEFAPEKNKKAVKSGACKKLAFALNSLFLLRSGKS